jgi:molybdopterin molybdotransferase
MISVREALACVLADLPRLGTEQVAITQARGRVLGEPITATREVPPFRNSAMDGFAVVAADTRAATKERPVVLTVLETVGAGSVPTRPVAAGAATRIMTGAVVPDGADAVVRVEDTDETGPNVAVRVAVAAGANVRHPGEDVRAGDRVLESGRVLRPADIGVLASIGVAGVSVVRRPRVAILVTGDELVDVGQPLAPGQIVNSNAYTLAAAVEEVGAIPIMLGIVRDQPERIRAAFTDALQADVVLSTGGVSMGSFDYVRGILKELGYAERFWKVAQKPGKPLTFGQRGHTPVFGLPGNPVSSLVCFYVYVVPALRTMMRLDAVYLPTVPARLHESIRAGRGMTEFVRCIIDGVPGNYAVRSTGSQSSGVLRSLSLGDGLIVAPPETDTLAAGALVRVMLLAGDTGSTIAPV